ncbi:MAG: hypothetical protein ACREAQ_02125 [Nitrososphaera sp.]
MSSNIPLRFTMDVEGDAEVRSKFESVGSAAQEMGEETAASGASARDAESDYLGAATGIAEFSINAFHLLNTFEDLHKIEVRIAESEKSVDTARARLLSSQEALTKLTDQGIRSGTSYEQATLRLKAAEQELSISQERVKITQQDLSDAQTSFALGIIPTAATSVTGLGGALTSLGIITKVTNIETGKSAFAFNTAGLGAKFHAISTGAATFATKGLAMATKLLHLAMGPVGLIILGVSTFLGLFATNAFGVRDAINQMGKAIGDAIPVLRPLLDALAGIANTIFPQAEEKTQDFSITTMASNEDVMASYKELETELQASTTNVTVLDAEMAKQHTAAFQNLQKVTRDTSISVSKSLDDLGSKTEKTADRITKAAQKAAAALRSLGLASSGAAKTGISEVKRAATGFSGMVMEPTLFLAGEGGPETVNISPLQGAGRGTPIMITVVTQLDGREVARTVNRFQSQGVQ